MVESSPFFAYHQSIAVFERIKGVNMIAGIKEGRISLIYSCGFLEQTVTFVNKSTTSFLLIGSDLQPGASLIARKGKTLALRKINLFLTSLSGIGLVVCLVTIKLRNIINSNM